MGRSRTPELDEIDLMIVDILSDDPRTPNSDIAAELETRATR